MVRLDDIPCAWCGDGSGESAFVLCDGCPNGGHLACLGLRGVPKNRWVCAVCADGGEGAGAPRSRVVRRPAHPQCVSNAANAANSGFGNQNRPRAPREGAWVTVAEERALWEGRTRATASATATASGARDVMADGTAPNVGVDVFGIDGLDGVSRSERRAIETHASFAKDAFARASARRREATARAAAAARAERAALDARRAERLALRDDDDTTTTTTTTTTRRIPRTTPTTIPDDRRGAIRASVRRGGQRDEPCRAAAAAASRDGGCARRRDTRRGNDARLLGGSPRTSSAAHRAFGRDDVGEGDRRAKNAEGVSCRFVRALRRDVRVGRP